MGNFKVGSLKVAGPVTTAAAPDVIDALLTLDNELVDWLLHASPKTDEDKREMREVLSLRTQLDRHVNRLVADKMKLATLGLGEQAGRLDALSGQIRDTVKTIATVKDVLGAAGEAVNIAAGVVAALAAI